MFNCITGYNNHFAETCIYVRVYAKPVKYEIFNTIVPKPYYCNAFDVNDLIN